MLILTAPAKTLDWESPYPDIPLDEPQFLRKTQKIAKELKGQSALQLEQTLHCSAQIASLNYERYQQWAARHSIKNSRPALFTFKGDVFQQLSIEEYKKKELMYLQKSLCILSGLYGRLRPFDLIQPYRLEMGCSVKAGNIGALQEYWRETLTDALSEQIKEQKHELVLNLASQEYAKAVDLQALPCRVVNVVFLQERNGETKTFGLLAKRARGMMIDHCARVQAKSVKDVKTFNANGYKFIEETDTSVTFLL